MIQTNEWDSIPTYSCLPTNHLPTTYRLPTDHLQYQPPTNRFQQCSLFTITLWEFILFLFVCLFVCLGRKSGKGFFTYNKGKGKREVGFL